MLNSTFVTEMTISDDVATEVDSTTTSQSHLQEKNKANSKPSEAPKRKSSSSRAGPENAEPLDIESDGVKSKKRKIYKQSKNFFGPPT